MLKHFSCRFIFNDKYLSLFFKSWLSSEVPRSNPNLTFRLIPSIDSGLICHKNLQQEKLTFLTDLQVTR